MDTKRGREHKAKGGNEGESLKDVREWVQNRTCTYTRITSKGRGTIRENDINITPTILVS